MKVKELIEVLNEIDGGREIFLASDEEGNSILPIHEVAHVRDLDTEGRSEFVLYPGGQPINDF